MNKLIKNALQITLLAAAVTSTAQASDLAILNLVTKAEGIHRVTYEHLKAL